MFTDQKKSPALLSASRPVTFSPGFFNRQSKADHLERQEGRLGRGQIKLPLKARGLKTAAN